MTAKDILFIVIIPLALAELGPWCGWLAARLLPLAARLRYGDTERATIRLEEWSSDLEDIPGQLTKLSYAAGQFAAGLVSAIRRKVNDLPRKINAQGFTDPAPVDRGPVRLGDVWDALDAAGVRPWQAAGGKAWVEGPDGNSIILINRGFLDWRPAASDLLTLLASWGIQHPSASGMYEAPSNLHPSKATGPISATPTSPRSKPDHQ